MPYKEVVIRKVTKEGLPTAIQEEFDENDLDFRDITYVHWIDLPRAFEVRDERGRMTRESKKPNAKNSIDQPNEADYKSEPTPRAHHKNIKYNTAKGKQQKTSIHIGT